MITGQFADVNKFKVPGLRGLAARAPYFHDGSARSLDDVVRHYDEHFGIGLDGDDRNDLVAFLESL
jgi:cytochrome c peroxidase